MAASPFRPIDSTIAVAVGSGFLQGVNLLQNALRKLETGPNGAACNMLDAFINQVQAQADKKLTMGQADQLMTSARNDRTAIGCR